MTLGVSRPRNWGVDQQRIALNIALRRAGVAYQVKRSALWFTTATPGEINKPALPFIESYADLTHVRRGCWEARHPFSGRLLATGISVRDVVGKTTEVLFLGRAPIEDRHEA